MEIKLFKIKTEWNPACFNRGLAYGSKCLLPPYEISPKPPTKWVQLTPLVQAAGWRNIDELHSAMLAGLVPRKP